MVARFGRTRRQVAYGVLLPILAGLLTLSTALPGYGGRRGDGRAEHAPRGSKLEAVRIGYQKYGTLILLKARGSLEKRLEALGISVKWTEFPAGPQLLEALNVGSVDFGTTGEAPPIFAQAAGVPLVYVAHEPPSPAGEAILVPKDSAARQVADLKGKKVALNKGSNVHYLLVQALAASGLQLGDVRPVYLPPADARAAFERGSVDAWVIWDPFLAAARRATGARVLTDGTGLVANRQFYLSSQAFAREHPDVVRAIVDEVRLVDEWAKDNVRGVAEFLSPQVGIDVPALEEALRRQGYGVQAVDGRVVADQQRIADTFLRLGLIPKPITVQAAVPAPGL